MEDIRCRQRQSCRTGRVSAWIAVGPPLHAASPWTLALEHELGGPMHEPSKPRGRHDRWPSALAASMQRARGQVRHRDVATRQPKGKERRQDSIGATHWSRSRDPPGAPVDRWRIIVAKSSGEKHHGAQRGRRDRNLRRRRARRMRQRPAGGRVRAHDLLLVARDGP